MSRLPKTHGRGHGRNRHEQPGKTISKQEEILRADLRDAAACAELAARTVQTDAQKRAHLVERLVPRLTRTNLERHLDRLHQILWVAARQHDYGGSQKMTIGIWLGA